MELAEQKVVDEGDISTPASSVSGGWLLQLVDGFGDFPFQISLEKLCLSGFLPKSLSDLMEGEMQ